MHTSSLSRPCLFFLWTAVTLQDLFSYLGAAPQWYSYHLSLPCSPRPRHSSSGPLAGSWQEQSELHNCSLPLLDPDCLVFVASFNAVLPDLCSEPEPGPRQPTLCHTLLPGPPRSPRANQGCFHVLLGGVAFKSELLMVEKMPLSVLGSLQQCHQGRCWRQK